MATRAQGYISTARPETSTPGDDAVDAADRTGAAIITGAGAATAAGVRRAVVRAFGAGSDR